MSTKIRVATAVAAGAGALLLAMAPAASATATTLQGTLCTCGAPYTYDNVRTATGGNFSLDLSDNTGTSVYIDQLQSNTKTYFGGHRFYSLSSAYTATNVARGTTFQMRASMNALAGANNSWGGRFNF